MSDLKTIRFPLTCLVLSFFAGVAVCSYLWIAYRARAQELASIRTQLEMKKSRLSEIAELESAVRARLPDFLYLRRLKVMEEDRLKWVAPLMNEPANRVRALSYQLDAKRQIERIPNPKPAAFFLNANRMRLTVSAVHEAEWLKLFMALNAAESGLYRVRRCKVDFRRSSSEHVAASFPLRSVCELEWLTIAKSERAES